MKEFENVKGKRHLALNIHTQAHPQTHSAFICCVHRLQLNEPHFVVSSRAYMQTTLWHDDLAFGLWDCNCNCNWLHLFMHFSESYFVYRPIFLSLFQFFSPVDAIVRGCCCFGCIFVNVFTIYLDYNTIRSEYGLHQFDILISVRCVHVKKLCVWFFPRRIVWRLLFSGHSGSLWIVVYAKLFTHSSVAQKNSSWSEACTCMCSPKTKQF